MLIIFSETASAMPFKSQLAGNANEIYVRLKYKENVWEFRYPDIIYRSGFDSGLDDAYKKDFRGRIESQQKPIRCSYQLIDAQKKFKRIAEYVDSTPVNAEIKFNPNIHRMFAIKDDIKGNKLDVEGLTEYVQKNLAKGRSVDMEILPDKVDAEITTASLRKAFAVRCEFSTNFSWSTPERSHNIELSLRQFNGLVAAPGETVSFNKTVGERTEERGYKVSKIIFGGEFVEGVGGGVCQTSTTLYNALLLADIKIAEYHKHTLAISYVPPSFDAMVNISTADLKFTNNSGNFLFFKTWTAGGRAYVRIYGEKLDYTIERKSTIVKEHETPKEEEIIDTEGKYKDLYEGERRIIVYSKPKKETTGELLYYRNGQVFKTVMLRKDIYMQLVGKEIIGTAKKPPEIYNNF